MPNLQSRNSRIQTAVVGKAETARARQPDASPQFANRPVPVSHSGALYRLESALSMTQSEMIRARRPTTDGIGGAMVDLAAAGDRLKFV